MADLFLTWDEAQGEQLPHYCVCCANPATEWADWQICNAGSGVFSVTYTYVDVTLPVCPRHRKQSWLFLQRIVARKIHDDGVLLSHVSPGFVEAVWDYRDEVDSGQPQYPVHRLTSKSRSRRSNREADDFDEPLPHHRTSHGHNGQNPAGWTAGKIILLVFVVLLLAPCSLFLLLAVVVGFLRAMF